MVVILHNIRSLQNVGSIFRTADGCGYGRNGVEKIYLCGITPEPVDELGRPRQQLIKVSLGAEKNIEWEYVKSITRLIDKLRKDGYKIFAIEQDKKSVSYYNIELKNLKTKKLKNFKIVLILGNEVKGLPQSILKRSDKILEIPMNGKKESLNVSVAFGIVAFHLISP